MTVSASILEETTKCEHNFSCLKTTSPLNRPACPVDYANGNNVLFLFSDKLTACPYHIPFGYGTVCTCPTRFAIYKRYGH